MNSGSISDSIVCLGKALALDLPDMKAMRSKYVKDINGRSIKCGEEEYTYRPLEDYVKLYSFPQQWGSSALGFGGLGCSAMTTAQTTVVIHNDVGVVYFGQRHAYTIKRINAKFFEDVCRHRMDFCDQSSQYER